MAAVSAPAETRRAAVGTTILLVEDDDGVRRFGAGALRDAGYRVVEAATGPDALRELAAEPGIALLFTDVVLKGPMTGRDLAEAVLLARPGLPVLYTTGYTADAIVHDGRLEEGPGAPWQAVPRRGTRRQDRDTARCVHRRTCERDRASRVAVRRRGMSAQLLLSVLSGGVAGFALGLVGGGGSILATPLLLYVVGVGSPHLAIGTGATAVSVAALFNFGTHARAGHVRWSSAALFAAVGVGGALAGSQLGKAVDGQRLLVLFGVLMVVVGALMLRPRAGAATPCYDARSSRRCAVLAFFAGTASGFFGVGGGFLIVPCLLFAYSMPMIDAVGSSLLAVCAFSTATAANYARSGLVDWPVAAWFVVGRRLGRLCRHAPRLPPRRRQGSPAPALRRPHLRRRRLRVLPRLERNDGCLKEAQMNSRGLVHGVEARACRRWSRPRRSRRRGSGRGGARATAGRNDPPAQPQPRRERARCAAPSG